MYHATIIDGEGAVVRADGSYAPFENYELAADVARDLNAGTVPEDNYEWCKP